MNEPQNHPLYSTDRENLDRLCAIDSPTSNNFVELARLMIFFKPILFVIDIGTILDELLNDSIKDIEPL